MGFPRQEYRSGLPFPSPGDLPDPGIEPASPALAGRFETIHLRLRLEHRQDPQSSNGDHTWFQVLMKLRFLMSHLRKNSVRDKVTGKKWIYSERNTLHRMWAISEGECSLKMWCGSPLWVG